MHSWVSLMAKSSFKLEIKVDINVAVATNQTTLLTV